MTPEVGIGALLKGDNVYCRKLGRSFQATPDHVRIILKLEIRQGHCSVKTQTNKIDRKLDRKEDIICGKERRMVLERDLHS